MKAAFHTLGCKVNSYETQAMTEQFISLGFEIVPFNEPADVYIINTCSVTQMAEHKSRQMLHRAKKLNPEALVIATGCYAQRDGENLSEDSSVDFVIGNNHKSEIARIVREALDYNAGKNSVLVSDLTFCRDFEPQFITNVQRNIRAYVKIQDGCDRFCSYCVIPYVRGRSRVREAEDIITEISALAENGYKEAVLTGIDISAYPDMAGLIEKVNDISGIERIRLGSIEEHMITDEFISRAKGCKKFCPHFHLSLQSGCDATLKRMNRKYSAGKYLEQVAAIRKAFERPGITTDIIVGFPGETDEEFEETVSFVKEAAFTQAHIFKFSPREGTRAIKMPDQVPEKVKDARSKALIELTDELETAFRKSLIGTPQEILAEEKILSEGRSYWTGFTREYVKCAVPASEGEDLSNRLIRVRGEEIAEINREAVLKCSASPSTVG